MQNILSLYGDMSGCRLSHSEISILNGAPNVMQVLHIIYDILYSYIHTIIGII